MFAAGPVANERKVPIVGTSTTANGITAIGPYVQGRPEDQRNLVAADQLAGGIQRLLLGARGILVGEDSAGSKEQALNAARKLIGRDKVPLILGPTLSNEIRDAVAAVGAGQDLDRPELDRGLVLGLSRGLGAERRPPDVGRSPSPTRIPRAPRSRR
jgi:hypothetical protein